MVLTPMHRVCRNERRALRNPVAFANFYAESVKIVDEFGTKRCAAANDILKSAAESIKNVLEELSSAVDTDFAKRI